MRDLPPTATLRAFEAATRHPTFTAAAQELHVSQSAVSHQLKHLETLWGLQLFERGQPLRLTAAGATLAPIVREFFISLEATLGDLREQKGRVRLSVSTTYSFALKWLLPRLPSLARQHPELLVSLDTTDKIIHFAQGRPMSRFGWARAVIPACTRSSCSASRCFRWPAPTCCNASEPRVIRPSCCVCRC